jgi:two-component system chemotaxis sensor kinase CheA
VEIDLNRFKAAFFEEAVDHLAVLESELLQLEECPHDRERLDGIFRAAHSVKGASGMFGFNEVSSFTHGMEGLLDGMRENRIQVEPALVELLLRSTDVLKALIGAAQGTCAAPAAARELLGRLHAAQGTPSSSPASASPARSEPGSRRVRLTFRPHSDYFLHALDPLLLLRDVAELGSACTVRCVHDALPELRALDPEACHLAFEIELDTRRSDRELEAVFEFVSSDCALELRALLDSTDAASRAPADAKPVQPSAALPSAAASGGANAPGSAQYATPIATPMAAPNAAPNSAGNAVPNAVSSTAPNGAPPARAAAENASIRVSTGKLDQLINLVGELVIAQSMVRRTVESFTPEQLPRLAEIVGLMERNTREIQDRVMAVRMVQVGMVFSRFPRLVRDLAGKSGKQIHLELSGEETELDKSVIEGIGDPLTHLVRNSADHGLESPDERVAAGKPALGTIRMRAFHEGGNVVIEVSDDGRGLDTARIRQKGIEQGLVQAQDAHSDEQIHALIFRPGFSTAQTVTDVSGRGVGMDVVKRNVEALKGAISITTQRGLGTTFRIRLPLTLAILDGLSFAVGAQVFVLPLLSILESFRPAESDVHSVLGTGEMVLVRGAPLQLLRLHELLDIPGAVTVAHAGIVVVVEHNGRRIGLLVDELLGQGQVVIKNLEQNFRRIDGVMGATITGQGRVALILDVAGLAEFSKQARPAPEVSRFESPVPAGVS